MRTLATLLALLALAACSDETEMRGACSYFALRHESTLTLLPPPSTTERQRIIDAASDGTQLVLLVTSTDALSSAPRFELWRHDATSGARISLRHLDAPAGCLLTSLTFDAADTLLLLAGCEGKPPTDWRIYALENNTLVQRHRLLDATPQLFGHDASGDRYCFFEAGKISTAAASAAELRPQQLAEAPGWGPTSGFDCTGGFVLAARDAFEGGMQNQLLLREGTAACTFEIEQTEGLTGKPELRLATVDNFNFWVVAPDGAAAHFVWDLLPIANE